jgi:hypothetical protein
MCIADGKVSFEDCDMLTWSFGCTGCLLPSGVPASWQHLVHVHVELGAAAGHPHMQREHVLVLAGEDFVASPNDQRVGFVLQAAGGVVRRGGGALEGGIGGDHLARDQILPDAEVLQRALGLRAPQLVGRHRHLAEAVGLGAEFCHVAFHLASSIPAGRVQAASIVIVSRQRQAGARDPAISCRHFRLTPKAGPAAAMRRTWTARRCGPAQRQRLVFARSTISLAWPLMIAFTM